MLILLPAAREEQDWLSRAKKEDNYSLEALQKKQRVFGTIILECDLNLPADIVYKAYAKRWEIELVMRYYKHACEFDETGVHDDYSVIGSELCDFLSTVLTYRLLKEFDRTGLLNNRTYKKLMSILDRAKKVRFEGTEWHLIKLNPSYEEILQTLGLLPTSEESEDREQIRPEGPAEEPVKAAEQKAPEATIAERKRGRPKGSRSKPKRS